MRIIHQLLGLVLGFIIGALTAITSVAAFFAWATIDSKSQRRDKYRAPKMDKPKEEENPLTHLYDTRKEAEEVLDHLIALILEYGAATVQDLRIALGSQSTFAESKKGWKTLQDATVNLTDKSFYIINFPDPINL